MFTLAELQSQLPAGAVTEDTDDVLISLSSLTGKATVGLSDTIAPDVMHDLLQGSADAQSEYNVNNPNATISTFSQPSAGTAVRRDDGTYRVNFSFNVTTSSDVDLSSTTFAAS